MPSKRALPNDLAVEQAILGLMIIDDATATTLLASLEIDDFCEENPQNRAIFSAIKRIKDKNEPVDFTTVTSELVLMKQLDAVGGFDYLKLITESVVSISNYEFYLNSLKDYTVLRRLMKSIN